jgi:AcrR family transcriptional regulator
MSGYYTLSLMNETSDVKRPYESPLRKAQAATTRRAIIEAASELFIERGYVATSIEAIAEAAGVSRATVFTSVGGKKTLLKTAYDVALVGDDEPIPFPLRPASIAVRAEPDPHRFLVGYTGLVVDINTRLAPIYEAVRGAASADPEVRDVFEAIGTERRVGAGRVIGDLIAKGGRLRLGLDAEEAADVLWILIDAGLFHLLVHQRRWSVPAFQAWLAGLIERELLG